MTQVLNPCTEFRDKCVPRYETQAVEKIVEVPQVQVVEATRQDIAPVIQEVIKEVPNIQVEYLEKVVEVQSQLVQEATGPLRSVAIVPGSVSPFQQSFTQESL